MVNIIFILISTMHYKIQKHLNAFIKPIGKSTGKLLRSENVRFLRPTVYCPMKKTSV